MTPSERHVLQQCVEAMRLIGGRPIGMSRAKWGECKQAIDAARELLEKPDKPLTTADKLNRLADVMEECGIEEIESMGVSPSTHFFKYCDYTSQFIYVELKPSDLRREAEEAK